MDLTRLQKYLDVVPLWVLLFVPFIAAAVFFGVPGRWRLPVMIGLMVFWTTLGRLQEFGGGLPPAIAKMTIWATYFAIAIAAYMDPGPKRKVSNVFWAYLAMSAVSVLFIITVNDLPFAMVMRFQWFAIVIAAFFVVRTMTDARQVMRVFAGLTVGLVFTIPLPLSDLVLNPGEAFRAGLGRLMPYEASSNQIGVLFAMAMIFGTYFALRTQSLIYKIILSGTVVVALAMALLTGSRSTMLVSIVCIAPLGVTLIRKPVVLAGMAVAGVAVLPFLIGLADKTSFDRFQSVETGRVAIFMEYTQQIAERPMFGLLGTQGYSFLADEEEGKHAHNAYLWLGYQGGMAYLFPMLAIAVYTGIVTITVFLRRNIIPDLDRSFITLLCFFMAMVYAHGFVNGAIYYPVDAWPFLHVMLSMFFCTVAMDLNQGGLGLMPLDGHYVVEDEDYLDYELAESYGEEDVEYDEEHAA